MITITRPIEFTSAEHLRGLGKQVKDADAVISKEMYLGREMRC